MSRTGDEKIWSRINWLCYAHNKGEGSCTYGAERYRPPRNARRLTEDLQREGDESIYLLIVPKSFCLEEDEKMMKKKREEKKKEEGRRKENVGGKKRETKKISWRERFGF